METTTIEKPTFDKLKMTMFILLLSEFIQNNYSVCQNFKKLLDECKSEKEIGRLFIRYREDIFERLGGDLDSEVDDLEYEINKLECKIDDLESEIEDLQNPFGNTMDDEFKLKYINEYHKNYTAWELEELLKNGKELLKQLA